MRSDYPEMGAIDGVEQLRDVAVPMRDGVLLSADVYRPTVGGRPWDGPLPVLLERTPYDKSGQVQSEISLADLRPRRRSEVARTLAAAGYAVVIQDCRGRYRSGGRFVKYLNEAADGWDTLDWLGRQPWCDGRVGTFGLSYGAHVQLAAACLAPPQLACMLLDSGGFAAAYHAGIRQGGAFELKQLTWAYRHALLSPEVRRNSELGARIAEQDIGAWVSRWPWSEGVSPISAAPDFESYILEQWRHGEDGPFWHQLGLSAQDHYPAVARTPALLMASWYDPYASTAVANYLGLIRQAGAHAALVLGPWTHGRRSETFAGDVDFGPAATLDGNLAADYDAFRLSWFNHWLKDGPPPDAASGVKLFVMGGGKGRRNAEGRLDHGGAWRHLSAWPADSDRAALHLREDGRLTAAPPDEEQASLSYRYDPDDPVPTIGGAIASGAPVMEAGAFDQVTEPGIHGATAPFGPLADRPDLLVFETPPLEWDMEIIGSVTAELFVSSDRPDTDFTVKLIDLYPPDGDRSQGYAMNLCHGILRARYRDSWTDPAPLEEGKIYRIRIEMFPTANLFKAGHRIRLDLSSSNFPHFDPNPNSGGPQGYSGPRFVAQNSIHLDRAHPSRLLVPLRPAAQESGA